MEQRENELRKNADREFIQSLNQLENILHDNPDELTPEEIAKTSPASQPNNSNNQKNNKENKSLVDGDEKIDLAVWEDAVADIEQFLESQEKGE